MERRAQQSRQTKAPWKHDSDGQHCPVDNNPTKPSSHTDSALSSRYGSARLVVAPSSDDDACGQEAYKVPTLLHVPATTSLVSCSPSGDLSDTSSLVERLLPKGVPLSGPPILVKLEVLKKGTARPKRHRDDDQYGISTGGALPCEGKVYYPKGTIVVSHNDEENENHSGIPSAAPSTAKRLRAIASSTDVGSDRPLAPPPYLLPHPSTSP